MSKASGWLALVGVVCVSGCFSMNIGGRSHDRPTMAHEITELRKLRDRGTISAKEYEMGKLTLLQQYHAPDGVDLPNASETQLASFPSTTPSK